MNKRRPPRTKRAMRVVAALRSRVSDLGAAQASLAVLLLGGTPASCALCGGLTTADELHVSVRAAWLHIWGGGMCAGCARVLHPGTSSAALGQVLRLPQVKAACKPASRMVALAALVHDP